MRSTKISMVFTFIKILFCRKNADQLKQIFKKRRISQMNEKAILDFTAEVKVFLKSKWHLQKLGLGTFSTPHTSPVANFITISNGKPKMLYRLCVNIGRFCVASSYVGRG